MLQHESISKDPRTQTIIELEEFIQEMIKKKEGINLTKKNWTSF